MFWFRTGSYETSSKCPVWKTRKWPLSLPASPSMKNKVSRFFGARDAVALKSRVHVSVSGLLAGTVVVDEANLKGRQCWPVLALWLCRHTLTRAILSETPCCNVRCCVNSIFRHLLGRTKLKLFSSAPSQLPVLGFILENFCGLQIYQYHGNMSQII